MKDLSFVSNLDELRGKILALDNYLKAEFGELQKEVEGVKNEERLEGLCTALDILLSCTVDDFLLHAFLLNAADVKEFLSKKP